MTKRSWPYVVGLATALLALVFTLASATNLSGAPSTAFNSFTAAPSGCEPTNHPGNLTATSLDHSMLLAMATFRTCTGNLDATGLNSSAFVFVQFSHTFEANSATNLGQTVGISSCAPGGCDPHSLLLAPAPSTGVLDLATAPGDDNNHIITPEPASLALLATGFVFMGGVLRRRLSRRREKAE